MRKKAHRRNQKERPPSYYKIPDRSMREKFASVLELPPIVKGISSRVEIHSNREIIIEGCKEILEYDENLIILSLGKVTLQVMGSYLSIRSISEDTAILDGIIQSVDFKDNEK